jgi:diacylglycerol kinase family enzyme
MRNTLVVLNERAGTLIDRDPREVKAELQGHFGGRGRTVEVILAHGSHIRRAIDHAAASDHDTIIVGGGDGSASYAAQRLSGSGKALGVLPLGTVNLLARDLGMPTDLSEALHALEVANPTRIDVGLLNGRVFHTLSGVGFFSQMARAREETRDLPGKLLRLAAAAARAFQRTGRFTLDIAIDGRARQIDSVAVLVTVNCFSGEEWRRAKLDDGTLEVHILEDAGALARLKAGADLLTGAWRENPDIQSFRARRIAIGGARRRAWVATDGELVRERTPLVYELRPRELTVLVPGDAPKPARSAPAFGMASG